MNVLVLGHKGMLGHMVSEYLSNNGVTVTITPFRYLTPDFADAVTFFRGEYIINCIGAIPQRTKDFSINEGLPIWLDTLANTRVIHPGTDCEVDEDVYGVSKRKARDYIIEKGTRTKILKTSIIGPELDSKVSLLEWFLNSENSVGGYTKAMWSGITTLEWAKQCYNLMQDWDSYGVENIIESTCLSKFDLLSLIREVFNKDIEIIPNPSVEVDKCLVGGIKTKSIKEQLVELKEYYYDN
jgi:dTDP-4-dehydrorhamnose reductase